MNRRRRTKLWQLAVVGATLLALAGCDSDAPTAATSQPPTTDARTAWIEAARCMRANGVADFPDPVQNEAGDWSPPQIENPTQVPAACTDLIRRAKQASRDETTVTAEELTKLRDYAKCMRERGIANHPDPDEDGNFGVPVDMENDPAYRSAHEACKQYLPPLPQK